MTDEFDRAVALAGLGLIEAFARFNRVRQAQLDDHAKLAATEATMWIVALDKLKENASSDSQRDYWANRNTDADGCVIPGLQWARNDGVHRLLIHHEWSDEPGINFSVGDGRDAGFNATVGEGCDAGLNAEWFVRWGPVPDDMRPNNENEPLYHGYVHHVRGQSVPRTLQAAARWLKVDLR